MENLKIKIKNHTDNPLPQAMPGGDWIDLYCAETVELEAGSYKLISLGISAELPEGYEAIVAARSSTPHRFGIICANGFGVIDNSYHGDGDVWKFPALAIRRTTIRNGDRIAQFRVQRNQPAVELVEVDSLGNVDRGGIGSTGAR